MNIPDFTSKYDQSKISNFEYSEILSDIRSSINSIRIPFPTVSLYHNELIERIRNNYNDEIFKEEKQVSLRTDYQKITEFGRVNKPHQSNFYGTLADDNLDLARITTVIETHKTLRTRSTNTSEQQIFTTSQWLVNGDLRLIIIPFHSQAAKNKRIGEAVKHFNTVIRENFRSQSNEILELQKFFSEHFGREVTNHLDYKLTAAFGEAFMNDLGLDGIIYPSIKSEFQTQNIVLNANAVKKLKLHKVGMFELFIHYDQVLIDPIAYAEDLGTNNNNFKWICVNRTPRNLIDKKLNRY